jgi:exodeoxyribonuclease VII large subunit
MQAYTLYELNEYIRRVIALNFEEPVWIQAEISQYKEVRGQSYLDLVEHDENNGSIKAQSSAVIWYKTHLFIKKKLGELAHVVLQEGSQVLLKVSVDFNEKYGLKLVVEDIDATYSIGQMQLARQKIIERIKKAGLLQLNSQAYLPKVVQNIAVISSEKAAGYLDFIKQLTQNSYGYTYNIKLFPAAMQGQNVEREVVNALREINNSNHFQCITIIRGGGSKLDLSYFDNFNIAHAIATSEIPVFTGIGHDIDESVADIVSYQAFKTPTAVADYLLEINLRFESIILDKTRTIGQLANFFISKSHLKLHPLYSRLISAPMEILNNQKIEISSLNLRLDQVVSQKLTNSHSKLEKIEAFLDLSDPKNILKKGYVIVRKEKQIVMDARSLKKGDLIDLEFQKNEHKAIIQ